jgi:hypothetical protein
VHGSHRTAVGLALVLVVTAFAHRGVLELELMGWDSWPTIAASRIGSASELASPFVEELMDGRYPGGHFWRPVTSLTFAIDWSLSRLDPFGYQRTNLLLLLGLVAAVAALARRLLGPGPGAWLATAVFALHPLHLETLPAAARRADLLASLFTTLAVLAAAPRAGGRARPGAAALCTGLAFASKEVGALALPMVAAAALLLPAPAKRGERLAALWRTAALPAAVFAALLALRSVALGGLGGHPESSLAAGALRGLLGAADYARSLLLPQPLVGSPHADAALFAALAAAAAAGAAIAARATAAPAAASPPARVLGLLGVWLAGLLVLTGVSGVRASWYGEAFLPAYAIGVGVVAEGACSARRAGRRAAAGACAAIAALLAAAPLARSGLVHDYAEWRTASAQARAFLARLDEAVAHAAPGSVVRVPGLPLGGGAPLHEVGIRSALCMTEYSAQAYADLAYAGRRVRVVLRPDGAPASPALEGVITIDALPLPSPLLAAPEGP